jgi:hypothetical protein
MPYGCEWRLESYLTTCPSGEKGDRDGGGQLVGQITP